MQGCPCGFLGSDRECTCTPLQIQAYRRRLSGPLLDRIDLHVEVPRVLYDDLQYKAGGESSRQIRERILKARGIQQQRFAATSLRVNAEMGTAQVRRYCALNAASEQLMKDAFTRLHLSARAYDRVLKVARTIADLEDSASIEMQHLAEALQYRCLDRSYWI